MASINLLKKTGISLSKGNSVALAKDNTLLQKICVGVNWGQINKKSFFGMISTSDLVDLDVSVAFYGFDNKLIDIVYYKKLESNDHSVKHSGDDRIGDLTDDDVDNEVITVDLNMVNRNTKFIVFLLNSHSKQDFSAIPYTKIRIFEGSPKEVMNVFTTFNLSSDLSFKGKISMIMGRLTLNEDSRWQFSAIGEPTDGEDIKQTVDIVAKQYLN